MKTLFLTGATGEIGQAIALKFGAQGYEVLGPNRTEMDLASPEVMQPYLKKLKDPIDAFVHCAGISNPKLAKDLSLEEITQTFQVNTFSFYALTHHLIKQQLLNNHAAIIAISSIYGLMTRKGRLAYSATKHALNSMVKTLALELGEQQIRVNGVAPGFVDTKMTRRNNNAETLAAFKKFIPLNRLASVHDIANVVYFLSSDENTYINGQCIVVDGGYSIGGFQA